MSKSSDSTLIIIEQYSNYISLLEKLVSTRSTHCTIVATNRTANHALSYGRLYDAFGADNIQEFDLNNLSDPEVDAFVSLMDEYGLWGNDAGLNDIKKQEIIVKQCRRALRAVLLRVFNAPHIRDRFDALFASLRTDNDACRAMIAIMLLQVFGMPITENEIVDVAGAELINRPSFRRIPAIAEVLNFRDGRVVAKSPILADLVVREFFDSNDVLQTLLRIVHVANTRRFDGGLNAYNPYKRLFKECIRFGNIHRVLGSNNLRQVFSFYEEARKNSRIRNHPHFWLQYAVARVAGGDLKMAERYFETAYSIAKRIDRYDTAYIDNHFSRYLFQLALDGDDPVVAMQCFRKAADILRAQSQLESNRHYPFRVAAIVKDLLIRFGGQLTARDIRKITGFIGDILGALNRMSSHLANSRRMSRYKANLCQADALAKEFLALKPEQPDIS